MYFYASAYFKTSEKKTPIQCWKMSSSTAARKFLTKYLRRKFSYLAENFCHLVYMQECRIIYLLFKKASCADTEVYHNVRHTLTYTGNSYFSILLPGREMYFLGLLLLIQTRFLKSRNISKCINKLLGSLL